MPKNKPTPKTLAIFDLDKTLTKRGTWGRFSNGLFLRRPFLLPFMWTHAALLQLIYKLGIIERVRVKQGMMRWSMVGKSRRELEAAALSFAQKEVLNGLKPGAIQQLQLHKDRGDKIIIVSAAVDLIVKPICELLEIQDFLATDMLWDENETAVAGFSSPNCYAAEKVRRFENFLEKNPELRSYKTVFYTDSHSDLPLLDICSEGVAVNPNKKLRLLAPANGFLIVDWEKT